MLHTSICHFYEQKTKNAILYYVVGLNARVPISSRIHKYNNKVMMLKWEWLLMAYVRVGVN